MYRTRFDRDIVAEFLPPLSKSKKERVIILCDGMPGVPRKQPLVEFLARKGFWVIYPRYHGAWESGGDFLEHSPEKDVLAIIDEVPFGWTESAFGRKFRPKIEKFYVIGGSFGGTVSLLSSLDRRVNKVVANCPIVDWSILASEQKKETSLPNYSEYVRLAFGDGYRLSQKNWDKLFTGEFFNPVKYLDEFDPSKILMFHAMDDPFVPWKTVTGFSKKVGAELVLLRKGGHIRTELIVTKYWKRIRTFLGQP